MKRGQELQDHIQQLQAQAKLKDALFNLKQKAVAGLNDKIQSIDGALSDAKQKIDLLENQIAINIKNIKDKTFN